VQLRPASLLILRLRTGLSGEGRREAGRSCTLTAVEKCKGHSERPLAEVFSQMPRCAPLRLILGEACRVPSLRYCQHEWLERGGG
jgi:hypothetical protein